jgi:Na+/melibiose symporter-like transporter
MKEKTYNFFANLKQKIFAYGSTNRLFLSYVIFSIIITSLSRYLTLGNFFSYRSLLADLGIILILGGLGYFVKTENQFRYFFVLIAIFVFAAITNTIYYTFYASFASLGELATLGQAETVIDSLFEKIRIVDFSYILFVFLFYFIHKKLKKTPYYYYISRIEKSKKMVVSTIVAGLILVGLVLADSKPVDFSRLGKQWNRVSNVDRFGLLFYQGNDIIQTLTPRIS